MVADSTKMAAKEANAIVNKLGKNGRAIIQIILVPEACDKFESYPICLVKVQALRSSKENNDSKADENAINQLEENSIENSPEKMVVDASDKRIVESAERQISIPGVNDELILQVETTLNVIRNVFQKNKQLDVHVSAKPIGGWEKLYCPFNYVQRMRAGETQTVYATLKRLSECNS